MPSAVFKFDTDVHETFETLKFQRNKAIVNVFSLLTAGVAFSAGAVIYWFVQPAAAILFPALLEGLIFLLIAALNKGGRVRLSSLLFFCAQNIAILYYGLVLEPSAGVHIMTIFTFALSFLLFTGSARWVAAVTASSVFVIISLNYAYRVVPPVIETQGDKLLPIIIYPVMAAHIFAMFSILFGNYHGFIRREKQLFNQLLLHKETLEAKQQELVKLNEFKTAYLRENSHELRGPIQVIFLIAEMLNFRVESKRSRENEESVLVRDLYAACHVVKSIINNVLELSKIEAGVVSEVANRPVAIRETLRQIVTTFRNLAAANDTKLSLSIADDVPNWIVADELKLTEIVINLLTNAIRHSHGNSHIFVRVCVVDHRMKIIVEDEGEGIPAERINKIFDLFATSGGNGIGLHITKRLVQQMGGSITVYSEPGEGTIFTTELPLVIDHTERAPGAAITRFNGSGLRALIIEDDGSMQKYFQSILNGLMRFDVTVAKTGREGIMQASLYTYDVIFVDSMLPDINAPEIIASLLQNNVFAPIILTSGNQIDVLRKDLVNAHFLDRTAAFLLKPFSMDDLNRTLEIAFHRLQPVQPQKSTVS